MQGLPTEIATAALIQEFDGNPLVADKKYWKKKLRIVGVVDKIGWLKIRPMSSSTSRL